jgi:multicomponent Na+:H+ antiporter subunit A
MPAPDRRGADMLLILLVHLAAALAAPKAVAKWGRRVFLVLAAAPAAAMVWALANTRAVLDGEGPVSRYQWVPKLDLDFGFNLDTLSWFMVLIVGGVGAVVLVYCSRYFAPRSSGLGRFAAVLTAFAGAMLGLVTSSNLIQMYVFWELTTVFSYLLIGHYSDRGSSRRAAMKAILVTTLGGLAMLGGILVLGNETGTYDIRILLQNPPDGTIVTVAIALLLVGAVTKSALIPFHFWLPSAMTAPTPVSAYLHAAAMVKAGIYLLARLAPGFALDPVWQAIVTVLGCGTFLFAGLQALKQYDLKLILAYGTVSQLGALALLVGSPYKSLALSGLALLGAHALFKACLFLTVGVVDATTGTRDIRRLNGLGRKMPLTATVAALGVASMVGLIPFAGYVAKEAAFEALFDPDLGTSAIKNVVAVSFVVGSMMTVAYGLRFLWGAFATKKEAKGEYPIVVTAPPWLLVGPPAILGLAGLGVALAPALGETLLSPYADAYPLGEPGHLAMFTGFTPAFITTIVVFVVGIAVFWSSETVIRARVPWPASWDGDLIYRHTLRRIDQTAAHLTAAIQRGSLPFYLGIILFTVIVFTGGAMLAGTSLPDAVRLRLLPSEVAVGALIVTATILAARARRRLKAVVLTGITGYGTALIFLLYGAPDLALTQVLVETVTLVVFVLVLRRLPVYFSNRPLAASRWLRIALGVVTGVLIAALAMVIPQYRVHEPISRLFPQEAVAYGGGSNIVNVALVDIRAWDTMGEMSVLLAAATGIASLIFLSGRGRVPTDLSTIGEKAGTLGATDPDPMQSLRARPGGEPRSASSQWLVGGITLAPQRRSLILEVATRLIYHTMIVFSIYLLFAGHNAPGGGFVAGLVTGIALVVRYLAGGRYELSAAAPLQTGVVLGTGLFLSAGLGLAAMIFGGEVLQSVFLEWSIPVIGDIKLVTSVFFDFGVYLVVIGLMLDILKSLGSEIDRHGESSGHDSDLVGPALEPAPPTRESSR